ncbi:MAG: group III truncated hemoglobin [Saprospiraceae bacterium]|nr:group III truncated hemoglobin [Saprospiraceae bacterium]
MKDIENRKDIESLVNSFYDKVKQNPIIDKFFTPEQGFSFERHIPIMCDFWETILLHQQTYSGSPVAKHFEVDRKIKIDKTHFDEWVSLFFQVSMKLFKEKLRKRRKSVLH